MAVNATIASNEDAKTEFARRMYSDYPKLMSSTETDDELLYLMMGSLGRLADLFKSGNTNLSEIHNQCVSIAAAAMCIGCPYIEPQQQLAPEPEPEILPEDDIPPAIIEEAKTRTTLSGLDMFKTKPKTFNSVFSNPAILMDLGVPERALKPRRDAAFFVYKHHSYGMTMKLEGWIRETVKPDEFDHFRNCGVDKSGAPLLGIIHPDLSVVAFIRCGTPQVKSACEDFLRSNYPNKGWR